MFKSLPFSNQQKNTNYKKESFGALGLLFNFEKPFPSDEMGVGVSFLEGQVFPIHLLGDFKAHKVGCLASFSLLCYIKNCF